MMIIIQMTMIMMMIRMNIRMTIMMQNAGKQSLLMEFTCSNKQVILIMIACSPHINFILISLKKMKISQD